MESEVIFSDLVEILEESDFNCFSRDYMNACWDDDFTRNGALIQTFNEEYQLSRCKLEKVVENLHVILSSVAQDSKWDEFWSVFQKSSKNPNQLSTFLCCLIARGHSMLPVLTKTSTRTVSCYLILLSSPGRNAYRIFSYSTLNGCLKMLQRAVIVAFPSEEEQVDGRVRKRKKPKGTGKERRKRTKTKHREPLRDRDNNDGADDDDDGNGDGEDDGWRKVELRSELVSVMKDLCLLCSSGAMEESSCSTYAVTSEEVVEVVVGIASTEGAVNPCSNWSRRASESEDICHLSYKILIELLSSSHVKSTLFSKICQKLLPHVTSYKFGPSVPRVAVTMRDNAVAFVRHAVVEFGEGGRDMESVVRNFIQHVCVSVPDRADHRVKAAEAVVELLFCISSRTFAEVSCWITERLARSSKVPHRMFAVDVVTLVLDGNLDRLDEIAKDDAPSSSSGTTHQRFVRTLVDRCSDSSPSVRSKAIGSLSRFTGALLEGISMETSTNRIDDGTPHRNHRNLSRWESTSLMQCFQQSVGVFNSTSSNATINLPDNTGLVSMVRRRCSDKRAAVRRSAVVALANMVLIEGRNFSKENLEAVSERCNDTSLAVKKQSLQSLTDILKHIPAVAVQREWLKRVLACSSKEQDLSIQSKSLELLHDVVIGGLTSSTSPSAWKLMAELSNYENYDLQRHFGRVCSEWNKKGLIRRALVDGVSKLIADAEHSEVAWFLLSAFSVDSKDGGNLRHVCNSWRTAADDFAKREAVDDEIAGLECSPYGSMMKILASTVGKASSPGGAGDDDDEDEEEEDFMYAVVDRIFDDLIHFRHRVNDIAFLVDIVSKMSTGSTRLLEKVSGLFGDLFEACRECVRHFLRGNLTDDGTLIRCVFTYGEMAQITPPNKVDRPSFNLLVQLITDDDRLPPPRTFGSSQGTEPPLSQFGGRRCSLDVRVFVFLSLGKFCLSSLELTKLCLPALSRELSTSDDARLRNNVIVVLTDLIMSGISLQRHVCDKKRRLKERVALYQEYAAIVDPYLDCISAHLRDPCPLVRKQTCLLFTRLLQEDFVKWKGTLFFRFLRCVVDENESVRETAAFTLKHVHAKRNDCLFFQNFVEAIFYFNDYKSTSFCSSQDAQGGRASDFEVVGDSGLEKRMEMYKFLLGSMADSQRFQIMGKLVNEVLTSFVDEKIMLNSESSGILRDVLQCLMSQEIKLSVLKGQQGQQQQQQHEEEDDVDLATAVENAAKKQFITQVMKRTVMETLLPVVVSLKNLLERRRSPMLRDLMRYLAILAKDYKNEIKDVLVMDPRLEREITFDLRRLEGNGRDDDDDDEEEEEEEDCNGGNGTRSKKRMGPPSSAVPVDNNNNDAISSLKCLSLRTDICRAGRSPRSTNRDAGKRRTSLATLAMINAAREARLQTSFLNKTAG